MRSSGLKVCPYASPARPSTCLSRPNSPIRSADSIGPVRYLLGRGSSGGCGKARRISPEEAIQCTDPRGAAGHRGATFGAAPAPASALSLRRRFPLTRSASCSSSSGPYSRVRVIASRPAGSTQPRRCHLRRVAVLRLTLRAASLIRAACSRRHARLISPGRKFGTAGQRGPTANIAGVCARREDAPARPSKEHSTRSPRALYLAAPEASTDPRRD